MASILTSRQRQQGVVLVVSLLMLLVLTMIGLAATRGTTIEQRMTMNQNDQEVAFQAAEAALRAGEGALAGAANLDFSANTNGAYTSTTMASDLNWRSIDWSPSGSAVVSYGNGIHPEPIVYPSYYIVYDTVASQIGGGTSLSPDQPVSTNAVYHIYARGVGLTGNVAVVLESTYSISNGI
jgi:type IV pilus assembly protein PilX